MNTLASGRASAWVTSDKAVGSPPSSGAVQHSWQKARGVMESNQIDVFAPAVFRDLEELGHIFETRTSCQAWRDVGHTDRPNRIHFDLTLIHAVTPARLDVGTCPYSNTAGNSASAHSLSELLGEDHSASLPLRSFEGRVDS